MSDETKTTDAKASEPKAESKPTTAARIPGAQVPEILGALNDTLTLVLAETNKSVREEHARLSVPTKAADDSPRHAPPEDQPHFKHLKLAVAELAAVQGGVARALDAWGRFVALAGRAADELEAHKKASGE